MFEYHGFGPHDYPLTRSTILSRKQRRMKIQEVMSDSDGQVRNKEYGLLSNATVNDDYDPDEKLIDEVGSANRLLDNTVALRGVHCSSRQLIPEDTFT